VYKHILVPTDGSPLSLKAAKEAARLAKAVKAKVTTVFVSAQFYPPMNSESIASDPDSSSWNRSTTSCEARTRNCFAG